VAKYTAIAGVAHAVLRLLDDHFPRAELANPTFMLYHPANFDKPMDAGFSLLLYHVGVASPQRSQVRTSTEGVRYRPSLPVDLRFLLTAWAGDAQRQMRLLGWAMRFLEDHAVLPAGVLNAYQADTFRPEEVVELMLDPLPLGDHLNLWDKLKPKLQASVPYLARGVLLDSDREIPGGPAVQSREFPYAQPGGAA
jgi:hypothetical protein